MSVQPDDLRDLAMAYGVSTEYVDWQGARVEVPPETIVAVLAAMNVDAATPEATAAALHSRDDERWHRMLPPSLVVRQGAGRTCWVHAPPGDLVDAWLELETGEVRRDLRRLDSSVEPRRLGDELVAESAYELPDDLPLGYHTLHARCGERGASTAVVVTPPWLGLPERLGTQRTWGFATQLYSVRSSRSWGVGDLTDLTDLAVWSASDLGAGFLLVNPLHAAEPVAPMEPSPYLPTSRRFVNPLYLRVEQITEYADLSPADRAQVDDLRDHVLRLDREDGIDRDTSWTAKREALQVVHGVARTARREADYRAFRAREGRGLVDFATWNAIAEVHGNDYRSWPGELADVGSPAVAAFGQEHADAVELAVWLQWVCDEQLQTAQAKAVAAGMSVGVVHDLAVGVHPGGADAWRLRETYAQGVQVGAPPDAFNQIGQDWSQPPWRPDRLAESGYAAFRQLLAALLRHGGGVRVDHVIGLFRLWWIPVGAPPSAGTYVRYDHEAMVGVLALEAARAGAVVVGEDLGVVEPEARDYLRERGILGTSILWFERDEHGRPLPAERWREYCLASVTTHDLPPTASYLVGDHVRLRDELELLTRSLEEEIAADEADRTSWLAEVEGRGLLPRGASIEEQVRALHRYLTLSPARMLCVALSDAVGDRRTQNQPGTTDEYPNWRVPLSGPDGVPLLLEDVLRSERAAALVAAVRDG